jgi:hypothetical protein
MEPTKNINISVKLQQAMDQKNKELGTSYMLSQANFVKRDHLNIPNNWPNPWKEIGDGIVSLFGKEVFRYKKYLRPAGFKIYGLSICKKYCRVWRGKKVLHISFAAWRPNTHNTVMRYYIEGMPTDTGYSRKEMRQLIEDLK